jgi:hypothetical protein
MPKCVYCNRPAWSIAGNGTAVNLCEQHFDIWLISAHIKARPITPADIRGEMAKHPDWAFSFGQTQIPDLLDQMRSDDWNPVMTHAGALLAS